MAKESKSKVVKKAGKVKSKKRWVQIVAPKSFDSMVLGDSLVDGADKLVGKSITVNLMTLNGDMRSQGVEIRFDVINATEGKGHAAVTGYELLPSALKRLIRRGRTKVADSFVVRTATGRLVRIKPIVITANPASSGAATTMRLAVREKAKQLVASISFDKLVQDLIDFKIQRALKDVANKVHPVKNVEVRMCSLLPEGTSEKREVSEDSRTEDFVEVVEPKADENASSDVSGDADEPVDAEQPVDGAAKDAAEESDDEADDADDGESKD